MSPPLPPVRLVLVRPRNPENLGAAARAMKNCGLDDWAWVAPQAVELGPARRMAVHAGELLDRARVVERLGDAIGDCVWVVGTSSRFVRGKRRMTPRAVAEEALERGAQGRVAIVFGDERSGLTNEEVDRCHDLSAAPTAPEQPSINLAQAVLLYSYEVRMAALAALPRPEAPLPIAATDSELALLESSLRQALQEGGFLVHQERHAMRDLVSPLRRARLSRNEARLWVAALKALGRARGR